MDKRVENKFNRLYDIARLHVATHNYSLKWFQLNSKDHKVTDRLR